MTKIGAGIVELVFHRTLRKGHGHHALYVPFIILNGVKRKNSI